MSAVTCEYCQAVLDPQVFSSGEKICYSCGRVIQDHGFANEASPRDAGGSAAVAQSGRHGKLTEYIRKVLGLSSQEVAELVGDDPKFVRAFFCFAVEVFRVSPLFWWVKPIPTYLIHHFLAI